MTPKLPRITARDLLRALERDGWSRLRQKGSHVQLSHPTKPGRVTVAQHAGIVISPTTFNRVLEQAGLTEDELRELL